MTLKVFLKSLLKSQSPVTIKHNKPSYYIHCMWMVYGKVLFLLLYAEKSEQI